MVYNKHLVILGSARSGTSWLTELIARQYRYRLLFEPEHEFNTEEGKLICDRFVTEANQQPEIKRYLTRVFRNRIDNDWMAQHSNRNWKRHLWPFIPKKFIIKFVRCNLLADYFNTTVSIPTIFIIRNPYDVLASQMRVKFPWLYDLSYFKSQDTLCDLILNEFGLDIRLLNGLTELETLCVRWCIENSIPFLGVKTAPLDIYKYEDIVNDITLFKAICETYGMTPVNHIEAIYRVPSSKTHPKSHVISGKMKADPFLKDDYAVINKYLDIFKIHHYHRVH
ncbi:sulfotransferase family protein [Aestuariibaculum marinum]|uniref:Sulfotransferase family protein n=1 Tax=Aestuariibaculum marinum TaxID=2683592 RepID=A0A8J6Q4U6_9FLAO|nr:sulfotransferase family protein [Aestuariibaculum marinum]MBD0823878.1 sulfotransferase family protein [Aestuariibaculum marinum]